MMKIRSFLGILFILLASACSVPFAGLTATVTPNPLVASLYIPPVCAGKPIATAAAPSIAAQQPISTAGTNAEISKSEQLRILNALSQKVEEIYLYPDYNGLDW